ncbi:MAG: T9SS type A sorting domain-containing protein [Bacteroidetes bacterium]|nr:T9SS type A sorting domain-containing protein [Bacteroidota bacterium]
MDFGSANAARAIIFPADRRHRIGGAQGFSFCSVFLFGKRKTTSMKRLLLVLSISVSALAAYAQWTADSLITPASSLYMAGVGTKAVVTDGTHWDLFNVQTGSHTSGVLSTPRTLITTLTAGKKAFFAGGKFGSFADPQYTKNVDVYNAGSNTWSTLMLSKNREVGGAGVLGNRVFFAGGTGRSDISGPVYLYNTIDIFNTATGARTSAKLSKARSNIAVGSAVNSIVFAGGWYWDVTYNRLSSNRVDIFNSSTGTWSTALLSKKRESISVAVIGDEVVFAGGSSNASGPVTNVDIYNASTNTWSTTSLLFANYGMLSAVIGEEAYFAGGLLASDVIQVYNTVTHSWNSFTLPVSLDDYTMTAINSKLYFAGGYDATTSSYSDFVQIYDPATGMWSFEYLSEARTLGGAIAVGPVGVFAGGINGYAYPNPIRSNRVDFYTAPLLRTIPPENVEVGSYEDLAMVLHPNPCSTELQISISEKTTASQVDVTIIDMAGRLVQLVQTSGGFVNIDVSGFPTGVYLVVARDDQNNVITSKLIKE